MKTPLIVTGILLWIVVALNWTIIPRLDRIDNKLDEQIKTQNKKIEQLELNLKEATKGAYLRRYFRAKGSVLADYATHFVNVADKYHLNPSLLPAVANAESGLCRQYIRKSFNCWGYGSGRIYFSSFDEAIEKIAKTLAENKMYRLFQKEKTIKAFALNYNKPYAESYEKKINHFINEIEKYK